MLMPKRVKYRKTQRGKVHGVASRGNAVAFGDFVHSRLGGVQCPQRRLGTQTVVAVIPMIGVHVQDRRRILRNPLRRWWCVSRRNNRFPGTGQAHKHHRQQRSHFSFGHGTSPSQGSRSWLMLPGRI